MANITLNSTPVTIKKTQTIEELIDQVIDHNEEAITKIIVNDESHEYDPNLGHLKSIISEFNSIDIVTEKKLTIAFDSLELCNSYVDLISSEVTHITNLYNANDLGEANIKFSELLESIDRFIHLITIVQKIIKANLSPLNFPTSGIESLETHLLVTLKDLVPAKENNDITMLCDLLQYELHENLIGWKTNIIPILKAYNS